MDQSEEAGLPPPAHPPHPKPSWEGSSSFAQFSSVWPSPRCVAALAQHPRMIGGSRGPGEGLPGEILVKHFHLHLPQRPPWITGQWASQHLIGGHGAAGLCVFSLHACFPAVPLPGLEVRMEETAATSLHSQCPFLSQPPRGQTRNILETRPE